MKDVYMDVRETTEGEKREIRTDFYHPFADLNTQAGTNVHLLKRSLDVANQLKVKEMSLMDAVVERRRPFGSV